MIDSSKVTWEIFLEALLRKEGRKLPNGEWATGDDGKALGPFQIWKVYWKDSGVDFPYEKCVEIKASKLCIAGYMKRHEYAAWSNVNHRFATIDEIMALAKCHNGGPNWRKKKGQARENLTNYWKEFRKILEEVLSESENVHQ
jgi:hypothetical protein